MTEPEDLFPELPKPDRPRLPLAACPMPGCNWEYTTAGEPEALTGHLNGNHSTADWAIALAHARAEVAESRAQALRELAADLRTTARHPDFRSRWKGLEFAAAIAEKEAGKA